MSKIPITKDGIEELQKYSHGEFIQYKNDREENVEPKCKSADAMYQCMQNRSIEEEEREKGTDSTTTPRAKTGSTLFYRYTNQFAAIATRMVNIEPIPFRYVPNFNPEVFMSSSDASARAAQYNALARWNWKKDRGKEKLYNLFSQVGKYANLPCQVIWKERKRKVMGRKEGEKKATSKTLTEVYMALRVLSWDSIYGNFYGGDIDRQDAIIIATQMSMSELVGESENYNPDQWKEFKDKRDEYKWDSSNSDPKEDRADNREEEYNPTGVPMYNVYDVYAWVPMDKAGEWDETNPSKLVWMTCIGNNINNSICVRLEEKFDPDNEIPIIMLHACADDENRLYHVMPSQVSRSMYSVISTLMNLAIDNGSNINDPQKVVNRLYMDSADLNDRVLYTTDVNQAMRTDLPPDTTQNTVNLISAVKEEWMKAMDLDNNMVGQPNMGRTSASEVLNIRNQSQSAMLSRIGYILDQLFGWYARKLKRYYETYAPEDMVVAISDESFQTQPLQVGDLYGDFDVDVFIVGEYIDDQTVARNGMTFLQAVGQTPALLQSPTHRVDVGELVKAIAKQMKLPNVDRIVGPPIGEDGMKIQREELYLMERDGTFIPAEITNDHEQHIRAIDEKAIEMTAQKGTDEYAWFEQLALPHREMHTVLIEQRNAGAQQPQAPVGEGGGTLPAIPPDQTIGQEEGGQIAGTNAGGI